MIKNNFCLTNFYLVYLVICVSYSMQSNAMGKVKNADPIITFTDDFKETCSFRYHLLCKINSTPLLQVICRNNQINTDIYIRKIPIKCFKVIVEATDLIKSSKITKEQLCKELIPKVLSFKNLPQDAYKKSISGLLALIHFCYHFGFDDVFQAYAAAFTQIIDFAEWCNCFAPEVATSSLSREEYFFLLLGLYPKEALSFKVIEDIFTSSIMRVIDKNGVIKDINKFDIEIINSEKLNNLIHSLDTHCKEVIELPDGMSSAALTLVIELELENTIKSVYLCSFMKCGELIAQKNIPREVMINAYRLACFYQLPRARPLIYIAMVKQFGIDEALKISSYLWAGLSRK